MGAEGDSVGRTVCLERSTGSKAQRHGVYKLITDHDASKFIPRVCIEHDL
jgi:hypothetical protein